MGRKNSEKDFSEILSWDVDETTGCWICNSHYRADNGYVRITVDYKPVGAHRYSYETFKGQIPEGHVVRHTCDRRDCINPSHLITGTSKQNSEDMVSRKRQAYGERQGLSKFKVEDIAFILKFQHITNPQMAQLFGVTPSKISAIRTGKVWHHTAREIGMGHLIKKPKQHKKISADDVECIMHLKHLPSKEVAKRFNVSQKYITDIWIGRKCKDVVLERGLGNLLNKPRKIRKGQVA